MTALPKTKPSSHRPITWAAGILCIACCAAPFVGLALGSATLAAFAGYFAEAAIGVVVLGVALLGYKFATRRKAPACDIDCSCRPTDYKDSKPKQD